MLPLNRTVRKHLPARNSHLHNLNLKLNQFVKCGRKFRYLLAQWLRMYSRIYHACEIATCMHLPDPIMLAAAAMIRSNDDRCRSRSRKEQQCLESHPKCANRDGPWRQTGRSSSSCSNHDTRYGLWPMRKQSIDKVELGQTLRDKGWGDLTHVSPCFMSSYTCMDSQGVLSAVNDAVRGMKSRGRPLRYIITCRCKRSSWTTLHGRSATWALVRAETQRRLKATYVDPILEVARMTTRAPIININHDPRFIALASAQGKAVHNHVTAFLAMGSYVALELRVRGCVVIHGSSFWSKMACRMKPALNGFQMLSWDAYGNGDERQMVYRGWAIYEKQLFTEKMVSVCFMDPTKVSEWDDNIKASILNQQGFAEIWDDRGRIDVSMRVSASTWFDAERRESIESGAQGDSIAEHASTIWQNFDVALIMPEPYYDQRQYWFKLDKYSSTECRYALGKTYYCHSCRNTQDPDAYTCARFLTGGNGYAHACIGCAHFDALKTQSFISKTSELVEWQRYGLASAMYAYDHFLQFSNPCEDMVAFLKACAPIAYTDYGKAISHYGGLRIAP